MEQIFSPQIRSLVEKTASQLKSNSFPDPSISRFDTEKLSQVLLAQADGLRQHLQLQPQKDYLVFHGRPAIDFGPEESYRQKAAALLIQTLTGISFPNIIPDWNQVAKIPNVRSSSLTWVGKRYLQYQVPTLSSQLSVLFRYQSLGTPATRYRPAQTRLAKFPDYVGISASF